MNEEENDFFERCFGIVAGLEVGNEAQAIAKEVVLDEVENLQQELTKYKERNEKLLEKINFYETTEWGLRGYETLKLFKEILEDKE